MKAFIRLGGNTYQMAEVTAAEMDALITKGDRFKWPHYFDRSKRMWPPVPEGDEATFYDDPIGK